MVVVSGAGNRTRGERNVALVYPFVASVAAVMVLGMTMLLSGLATIVTSFWAGKWGALLLQLLIGVFYAVVGFIIMDTPIASTVNLTLVSPRCSSSSDHAIGRRAGHSLSPVGLVAPERRAHHACGRSSSIRTCPKRPSGPSARSSGFSSFSTAGFGSCWAASLRRLPVRENA